MMKELEETNCEIRNVINFELPLWDHSDNVKVELATIDGSKDSSQEQTLGAFLSNECKYAWLSHESCLVVIDVRYGRCISCWNFPSKITTVFPFPTESGQVPLLLVGLDNNAIRIKDSIGHLCIFDCCTSTVLTTIQVPAGVEKACIIHGGAEWEEYNEKRPDTVLPGNTGLIFAALRNLQHIVIDINRSLWQNAFYEGKTITGKLEFVNNYSETNSTSKNKEPTHLTYDLLDREIEQFIGFDRNDFESTPLYDESLCTILLSSTKIGCLITGCLGRVIIWQNDGSIGWISPSFDENSYVTHIALLEPSDDPRPFYYLWVACQNDSSGSSAVLRMYAMFFNKKHSDKTGESSLYYSLESEPSLKFELELEQGERVHSLIAVERENPRDPADTSSRHGEDSLLLIGSNERLLLFDLNRWYKEQMPRTMAECRNPNSVMASYRTKSDEVPRKPVIACSYIPRSLREFANKGPSSPEELFYPNSLTLEWVELAKDSLVFWLARGVQAELLREMTIAGPIVLVRPTETYRRCLMAGLVPFDVTPQDYSLDADKVQQREMLLSLCLEQRWTNFLVRCAIEWSDGSAAFLYPEFLRWGVQRASELKFITDRLCIPLFDQSGSNIGETEAKTLRFCCQQLECLATVVSKLPNLESDLERQRRALKRIATYLQVLLWFYDVALLPETQEMEDEDDMPQIPLSMKIPYPKDKLTELYKKKRRNDRSDNEKEEETLFIDQLLSHNCQPLKAQWEREADSESPNPGGHYPPPSLQTLLRSYLTDCHRDDLDSSHDENELDLPEMKSKHSITIYLLMDLAMLLQGSHPGVDRLIKYPSAFKLSPSLIKITQAFWLLDHEDYDGFFKIMTGQLIVPSDIKNWEHKVAINALLRNDQHKLALMYLRVLKPPLSSLEDQGILISLSVEQGLVESAFHARPPSHYAQLLTKFFETCKAHGKLHEILHLSLDTEEEEAFVKFLKENGCDDTRLLYFLQRCRHTEASDVFACDTNINRNVNPQKKIHPTALQILGAFNATLPDITKRFATNLSKTTNTTHPFNKMHHQSSFMNPGSAESRGYPCPMSNYRNNAKGIYEVAVSKTRETCLKADRTPNGPNYIPFLGAPCSTIVFCTKVMGGSTMQESAEANNVLFPEKKVSATKRTRVMINEEDDNVDGIDRKRRRLGSNSDMDLSRGDNDAQMSCRLSMSQACNTPLVPRKIHPEDGRDPMLADTPHSILKIRQMIRRNSGSPGFGFENGSISEREAMLRRTPAGDTRSARQIRFSMDRLSNNDDSVYSTNGSNRDESERDSNNTVSSKYTEEESNVEEIYYSPNVSVKSMRDSSILSDNSITKFIRGPRPRPGLRRSSSLLSHASTEHKSVSSGNTTLDISVLDITHERKSLNISSISPRKPVRSPSLYSASILSADTSFEASPLKRPFTLNNNKHMDDESEESENASENEEQLVAEIKDTGLDKDLSIEPPSVKDSEVEGTEEEEAIENSKEEEVETQDEEENEKSILITRNLLQECVISEDEESKLDKPEETQGLEEYQELEDNSEDPELEQALEEGELEDSFQSFPSSHNATTVSESHMNKDESLHQESNFSFMKETRTMHAVLSYGNYSLTEKFNIEKTSETDEYESGNYSLTKPIFLDHRGIVKFDDSVAGAIITDDESMDADVERPEVSSATQRKDGEEQEEEEENEPSDEGEENITLNLSDSDESGDSAEKKIEQKLEKSPRTNGSSQEEVNKLEKETSSLINQPSETELVSEVLTRGRTTPVPKKESSVGPRSRMSSLSSAKSDDLNDSRSSVKRSPMQLASTRHKIATPRRSIRTVSKSPVTIAFESVETEENEPKANQARRSASISKEVKKILSKVVGESVLPEIRIEPASPLKEEEPEKSTESKTTKISRIASRQISREPSQDTNSSPVKEESPVTGESPNKSTAKRSSRTAQKGKNAAELIESTITATRTRATRAGSIAKDSSSKEAEKPARNTRATSVVQEPTVQEASEEAKEGTEKKATSENRGVRASSIAKDTAVLEASEETAEKKTGRSRAIRASSMAKEPTISEQIDETMEEIKEKETGKSRATRAASVAKDTSIASKKEQHAEKNEEESHDDEKVPVSRATRASSLAKDTKLKSTTATRKTRASSVVKEEKSVSLKGRKTRAASLAKESAIGDEAKPSTLKRSTRAASVAKETALEEEVKLTTKRATRASSLAKDTSEEKAIATLKRSTRASSEAKEMSVAERDETQSKRLTKKRGGSVPKEISTRLDSKLQFRNRRSTSLLKEVILEESLSMLDSPVGAKVPRISTEAATSTPAANTRSRRSSIQSVPEEVEQVKDEARGRRAVSVDSTIVPGKRMTRSTLAKTSVIDEVIPEELSAKTKAKPVTRRKRATSVTIDTFEVIEKEKVKAASRSKRGRKVSENKDFHFSSPEAAGQDPESIEGGCQTPTYEFSEPTGLQKFVMPVRDDKEFIDVTTNALKLDKLDSERTTLTRVHRRPRTCFVLPKGRNKKRTEENNKG